MALATSCSFQEIHLRSLVNMGNSDDLLCARVPMRGPLPTPD